MRIFFYLRYHTKFGQSLWLSGNLSQLGNDSAEGAIPLNYLDHEFWLGSVEVDQDDLTVPIEYHYILRDVDGSEIPEGERHRMLNIPPGKFKEVVMVDTWNYAGQIENTFYTQPFKKVLLPNKFRKSKQKPIKLFTHEFRVKSPLLGPDEMVCIIGSGKTLGEWGTEDPHLFDKVDNWYTTRLNFRDEAGVQYKYAIYNAKDKIITAVEQGEKRLLFGTPQKKKLYIQHDGFTRIAVKRWRGAGVAIPVFSLRSEDGFGTGEFQDIKLLVDWAKQSGLRLIQILPVNDTTSSKSWMDSYPYSAVSAFALHPVYINLEKLAGQKHAPIINALKKKKKALNQLAEFDYEQVSSFKRSAAAEIFAACKNEFKNDKNFFEFFDLHRHWLVPYAAFCYLRDKNGTADFSKWKSHKKYREDAIQRLVSPSQPQYDEILFQYFLQYHLHLQLKEASDYAHKNGIVLKGDIPIGISRNSADAWIQPELYNMEEQAGAPPDDFAVKGQNWGFPTYNWTRMKEDGFSWWRNRFEQMSEYFDAFRIDHILGFFRIWSIPMDAVEGILGRFIPAIPVNKNEFVSRGISFDHDRFCKPFINDAVLASYPADIVSQLKSIYLESSTSGLYQLKEEFNTQRKAEGTVQGDILPVLYELIANVILIPAGDNNYHFRISMERSSSFNQLDEFTKNALKELYVNYFYHRQDAFWKQEALHKLPGLALATDMLVCGEDLGMVPHCVPEVMKDLSILSLDIQRMPKDAGIEFFHPKNAPYLSVVTPSTHDMSTVRGWWEEDRARTQRFYNKVMGHYGEMPYYCEPWVNHEIVIQHLYSPAMWSIFQLQDILGMSDKLRRENPHEERINEPSDPKHYWRYRMHINLEDLIKEKEFNGEIADMIKASGRD